VRNSAIEVKPVNGYIGAEVGNIDLAESLSDQALLDLRNALAQHGVIFFRDQSLTPEQHDAFARRFGTPTDINFVKTVEGHANMSIVSKEEDQLKNIGGGWHADQTYYEKPPFGAVLVARELPAVGGDTLFSSMAAAYDALSEGLRGTLDGLRAVHSNEKLIALGNKSRLNVAGATPQYATHPVVIRHPVTGRKSLFVNRAYTLRFEGWSDEDSAPLLDYLYRHGQQPEFQVRFQWEPGSVAFWDNIQVWHYAANDYQGRRRVMHRVAVQGDALLPA
jgi:taurine dioxygenase